MRVLDDGEPLEHLLDHEGDTVLAANDRALARAIASTVLRRRFQIDQILAALMEKPLGKRGGVAMHIMRLAVAQILFMEVPDHAAVSVAMDIAKSDHKARHFSRLINGVLRQLIRERESVLAALQPRDILPAWLSESWEKAYGHDVRDLIAESLCHEPYLDLAHKPGVDISDLGGVTLPTGAIRLKLKGSVPDLPGFAHGDWWVQDAAASLAASLLGDVEGCHVLDLCAAPGGKAAFLASRGADIVALDVSAARLVKLKDNFKRLKLKAQTVTCDVMDYQPDTLFDAVLLDAPCSATGTARKHPDIFSLKSPAQVSVMATLQKKMFKRAVGFLKPGGTLIYCTCSLQVEEGEAILSTITKDELPLDILPVTPAETGGVSEIIRADGTIRTLPYHMRQGDPVFSGMDGFFIARFQKHV